jgi:hypothetical protein
MATRGGYDGQTTGAVEPFTKEQRQRLEALTFARKLTNHKELEGREPMLREWLQVADYIVRGPS